MLFDKLGAEVLLAEVRRCLLGAQLCPKLQLLVVQSRPQPTRPAPKMGTFGANLVCDGSSCLPQDQQPVLACRICSLLRLQLPAKTPNPHESSFAPRGDLGDHEGFGSFLPGITKTHLAVAGWDVGQETQHKEPAASPASQPTGQGGDPSHPSPPSLYVNP